LKKIGVEEQKTNFTICSYHTISVRKGRKGSFPVIKSAIAGSARENIFIIIAQPFLFRET